MNIRVEMKRGGSLVLEAHGRCYSMTDGSGRPESGIEDLELFWPGRKSNKKRYPVKEELVKDWNQVEEAFWEASANDYDDRGE